MKNSESKEDRGDDIIIFEIKKSDLLKLSEFSQDTIETIMKTANATKRVIQTNRQESDIKPVKKILLNSKEVIALGKKHKNLNEAELIEVGMNEKEAAKLIELRSRSSDLSISEKERWLDLFSKEQELFSCWKNFKRKS